MNEKNPRLMVGIQSDISEISKLFERAKEISQASDNTISMRVYNNSNLLGRLTEGRVNGKTMMRIRIRLELYIEALTREKELS